MGTSKKSRRPSVREVEAEVAELVAPAVLAVTSDKEARRAVIAGFSAKALDQNPVAVYLARMATKDGRRVQLAALKVFTAELFDEGDERRDPFKLPWADLRYQHVVLVRTKLGESGKAPAYVNRILSAVRGVVKEAVRLEVLDPTIGGHILTVERLRGERLPAGRHLDEQGDLEPLFDGAEKLVNPTIAVRDTAILAVLRVAGVRRAELVKLQLDDVAWGSRAVRHKGTRDARVVYTLDGSWKAVVRGKGNKERQVYLANAAPEIRAWLKLRGMDSGPLFCAVHKTGSCILDKSGMPRQMHPSSVEWIVNRAGDAGGVHDVSPHDFRRTYVGDLLDSGADIATVQKLAGHASVTTTQRYDRRPEKTAEAASAAVKVPGRKREPVEEG